MACTAYSPLQTHLPGYVTDRERLKAKGVEVVACLTVNDACVTSAWGEAHGATGKVKMLADHDAAYTKVDVCHLDIFHSYCVCRHLVWSLKRLVTLGIFGVKGECPV